MDTFLGQVASHYFKEEDINRFCFIFPNRRSLVFFKKHLGDLVRESGNTILVPPLITVNDFFSQVSRMEVTDSLRLTLELYEVYKGLNKNAESLDEFVFWAGMLLQDFDDVDKYLVDAKSLFRNVADFKGIQDSFDYLTEGQRKAIEHFLSHFRDGNALPKAGDARFDFLSIWNILYPLYKDFNQRLRDKDMAYEGMVYRVLAQRLKEGESVKDIMEGVFPESEVFVFVGLNALNECERTLLKRMRDARMAHFVWDFVSPEIKDHANKSSFFMRKNLEDFPQAFPIKGSGKKAEIKVISVPSSTGQAKLAGKILEQCEGAPVETAFVLPDENLLLPLLHSIPPSWDSVNVTMGCPMSSSAVFTLVKTIGQLQLRMRHRQDGWFFYHREVGEVFSSGLFRSLLSEEEAAVVTKVKNAARYYVADGDIKGGPLLDLIFRPIIQEPAKPSAAQNHRTEEYLSEIVAFIGRKLAHDGDMLLELDFAKRCHTQLNILRDIDLELTPQTHFRLLLRSLEGISVPFKGEPLKGLQIMGPLETRALDFRNLVIFSANEGVFPRHSQHSSFIPPELRKGFGLPTHEYQDAVWAYYFYRMIQRPEKVWLIYDSRTEGIKSGEESRYIKQLKYHFDYPIQWLTASSALHPVQAADEIQKTEEHIRKIREGHLSASTIQSYLYCPAKFYYQVVEGLSADKEVAESLDSGMLGNVFHHVMQKLYDGKKLVTGADIGKMLNDKAALKAMIRAEILDQMRSIEVTGRNLILERVLLDYVLSTLKHDKGLLEQAGSEGFRIIGLEEFREAEFGGMRIIGFVDRIDSYKEGEVRIVDYKTGKVAKDEIYITDESAEKVVGKLFGKSNNGRPKIALQLFLYDLFAHADASLKGMAVVNSIYGTQKLLTLPPEDVPESPEFSRLVKERLKATLEEMTDVNVPFKRTAVVSSCENCDFRNICGR